MSQKQWLGLVGVPPALPAGVTWDSLGFALRTTAASLAALYVAFRFDLEEPKWAPMTVWVVAQATRGMSLSKSQYRLIGTVVGAAAGVALIALFAQTPELFFLALAVWMAVCTAASSALRNFRSYGAVLAGYTAAIIAVAASAQPASVFDTAVARVSCIALGVVMEAGFSNVFYLGNPIAGVAGTLDAFLRQAARICGQALRGRSSNDALQQLFAQVVELDTAGEYAAMSSPTFRRRFGHLRGAVAAALSELAAAQSLREHGGRYGDDKELIGEAARLMDSISDESATGMEESSRLLARVRAEARGAARSSGPSFSRLLLSERLELLIASAREALTRRALLDDLNAPASRMQFHAHVDWGAAVRNGVRTFIAVLAAAAFWVATAWPSGGGFLVMVAVVCSLFATRRNAIAAGAGFFKGASLSVLAAAFCNFVLLRRMSDFVMLTAVLTPFLIAGGLAMRRPSTAAVATGFTMFFISLVGPENAARPDMISFLNDAIALLIGIACGAVVFALVLPPDPLEDRRRLHAWVRRDLEAIGRDPSRWSQHAWLARAADRMGREFAASDAVSSAEAERDLRGMLAALTIGHAAISLAAPRRDSRDRLVDIALRRLADGEPLRLARLCRLAVRRLMRRADSATPADGDALRAAVLMEDIGEAAANHADFLRGRR
ncbi:MAG TPA: FUSC family protein [Roseiarcus sp.]